MTSFYDDEIRCGLCGTTSTHAILASYGSFGMSHTDLDFHVGAMDSPPIGLQQCPSCSLIAEDLSRPPQGARKIVRSPEYLQTLINQAVPKPLRIIQCRALIAERCDEPSRAFEWLLAAAWAAGDAKLTKLAGSYRRKAAHSLEGQRNIPAKQMLQLVDIHRRAEDWASASKVIEELQTAPLTQEHREILIIQSLLVQQRDADRHSIPRLPNEERDRFTTSSTTSNPSPGALTSEEFLAKYPTRSGARASKPPPKHARQSTFGFLLANYTVRTKSMTVHLGEFDRCRCLAFYKPGTHEARRILKNLETALSQLRTVDGSRRSGVLAQATNSVCVTGPAVTVMEYDADGVIIKLIRWGECKSSPEPEPVGIETVTTTLDETDLPWGEDEGLGLVPDWRGTETYESWETFVHQGDAYREFLLEPGGALILAQLTRSETPAASCDPNGFRPPADDADQARLASDMAQLVLGLRKFMNSFRVRLLLSSIPFDEDTVFQYVPSDAQGHQ